MRTEENAHWPPRDKRADEGLSESLVVRINKSNWTGGMGLMLSVRFINPGQPHLPFVVFFTRRPGVVVAFRDDVGS